MTISIDDLIKDPFSILNKLNIRYQVAHVTITENFACDYYMIVCYLNEDHIPFTPDIPEINNTLCMFADSNKHIHHISMFLYTIHSYDY